MSIKNRLTQLEKRTPPEMSNVELTAGINRILETPHLVSPQAYSRIVEILEACKQRQATHEHK